jgi:hypothetical protein
VLSQHLRGAGVQRQDAFTAGLGVVRSVRQPSWDDLLAHQQPPALQIQVGPAQPDRLARDAARAARSVVERVQRVPAALSRNAPGLLRGPHHDRGRPPPVRCQTATRSAVHTIAFGRAPLARSICSAGFRFSFCCRTAAFSALRSVAYTRRIDAAVSGRLRTACAASRSRNSRAMSLAASSVSGISPSAGIRYSSRRAR